MATHNKANGFTADPRYTYEVSENEGYPKTWAVVKLYADSTADTVESPFDSPDHAQARADELAEGEVS